MPQTKNEIEIVFFWETVDFIKSPKIELFLAVSVIASMGMILWGIYTRSFIMALTFIMLAAVSIMVLNEEPRKVKVKISEQGIDINEARHEFKEFKSFEISHSHGTPILSLRRKEPYLPAKTVYIENEPVEDLEEFLEIYLPKE